MQRYAKHSKKASSASLVAASSAIGAALACPPGVGATVAVASAEGSPLDGVLVAEPPGAVGSSPVAASRLSVAAGALGASLVAASSAIAAVLACPPGVGATVAVASAEGSPLDGVLVAEPPGAVGSSPAAASRLSVAAGALGASLVAASSAIAAVLSSWTRQIFSIPTSGDADATPFGLEGLGMAVNLSSDAMIFDHVN